MSDQENFFTGKKRRTGSNLAFNDLLFNVLIGFVMLFVIAFLMINPIAKKADIPVKAEFIVVLEWDEDAHEWEYLRDRSWWSACDFSRGEEAGHNQASRPGHQLLF